MDLLDLMALTARLFGPLGHDGPKGMDRLDLTDRKACLALRNLYSHLMSNNATETAQYRAIAWLMSPPTDRDRLDPEAATLPLAGPTPNANAQRRQREGVFQAFLTNRTWRPTLAAWFGGATVAGFHRFLVRLAFDWKKQVGVHALTCALPHEVGRYVGLPCDVVWGHLSIRCSVTLTIPVTAEKESDRRTASIRLLSGQRVMGTAMRGDTQIERHQSQDVR
jgi:hypothetical protein